jgi:hypothetical protein
MLALPQYTSSGLKEMIENSIQEWELSKPKCYMQMWMRFESEEAYIEWYNKNISLALSDYLQSGVMKFNKLP